MVQDLKTCVIPTMIFVCYELLIKHFDSLEPQQFYAFAKPFLKSIPEKILSMCKQIYDEQWDFLWLYLVGQDNKEENKAALDI